MKLHYLYKITNKVNGKLYIGVSNNPKNRLSSHLGAKDSHKSALARAVVKHGKENFYMEILCVGSRDYIYDLEVKAIAAYNSLTKNDRGYNITIGGRGGLGEVRGPVLTPKSNDKFYYVAGFWFPNKRIAVRSLNWGDGKWNHRRNDGTLGLECLPKKIRYDQPPVYVAGFWFKSKKYARKALGIGPSVYERRRKEGTLGEVVDNFLLEKAVRINNIVYDTVEIASKALGIHKTDIYQKIKIGKEGYTYEFKNKNGALNGQPT